MISIIKNLEQYIGQELAEDEYLLKLRPPSKYLSKLPPIPTGFITKLTQKKQIPLSFENWGVEKYSQTGKQNHPLQIYVFKETFREGWKIKEWRFGQSQNWATMIHPLGFTLEIYLTNLLEIITNNYVNKGTIVGEFKWQNNMLVKQTS